MMLASTSRTVLLSRAGTSAFSTSAVAASRSRRGPIVVELLTEVPGLGQQFDRVEVAPGRMRNVLAPSRMARYLPWKRASQRATPFIAQPSRPGPSDQELLEHPAILAQRKRAARPSNVGETPTEILSKLHTLPTTLTFARRTISPETPALHGSLTLSDVADHIAHIQGLTGHEVEVNWVGQEAGARMKELGSWEATVAVKGYGGENVKVEVEVVRQD